MSASKPLYGKLSECLKKDQFVLKRRLQGADKISDSEKQQSVLAKIEQAIEHSISQRAQRLKQLPNHLKKTIWLFQHWKNELLMVFFFLFSKSTNLEPI